MQVERDAGSARGRGERRLRSWLRHERLTVAMAVAEATHHSSRGQRPATIITEVEEHEAVRHGDRRDRRLPRQGCGRPVWSSRGPATQIVCQLMEILKKDIVQVIEVPKISQDPIPQRALLRAPQLAEQLVEVPTTPGNALAVVAVQTLGWREARALLEQLNTARPGRDTNTGRRDGG